MSKVEDLAKELFPLLETDKIGNNPYITYNIEQLAKQKGFVKGYHQAEQDLELGWEQIYSILYFEREVLREFGNEEHSNEEVCKEVLKRFKDFKERKDGGKG